MNAKACPGTRKNVAGTWKFIGLERHWDLRERTTENLGQGRSLQRISSSLKALYPSSRDMVAALLFWNTVLSPSHFFFFFPIAGHLPIHPGSTNNVCLAWNYKDALSIIHSHQCVVCFLAGHLHDGGYCLDSHGVHHLTVEGIIETPPQSHAFGTIYVYEDRMILKGKGRIPDKVMYYRTQ